MHAEATPSWGKVAQLIANRWGLHFPGYRLPELRRGLEIAAGEIGLGGANECAHGLLTGQLDERQSDVVASHLTIGETYFFRGEETFAALAGHLLPALIKARRRGDRHLRLWSAGCCTGEEAYSLAIVLRELLPDIKDWHISILATDINSRFLRKATEGAYGQWSFRGTAKSFRDRWFKRRSDGLYQIAPEIRSMVTFAPLNLVDSAASWRGGGINAMDLVLCRNVLMYFTTEQAGRVVTSLHGTLREDGWLVVAPCEVSQALFRDFLSTNIHDTTVYQKHSAFSSSVRPADPLPVSASNQAPAATLSPAPTAIRGRFNAKGIRTQPISHSYTARTASTVPRAAPQPPSDDPQDRAPDTRAMSRRAHALADQGKLSEALTSCDSWIAGNKLDSGAHYLRAMVLMERGDLAQARIALQRSLYLAPDVAMTCFAAGNLERALGRRGAARLHYRHALEVLDRARPDAELRHSEGVTAKQLAALVADILMAEVV